MGLAYGTVSFLVVEAVAFGYPTGSVFWPGAGLTLGVLLVRPRRTWPALLAGVFIAEIAVDLTIPVSLGLASVWALANTVEPLVGAYLLTRKHPEVHLANVPAVIRFLAIGVTVGPLVGATVGASAAWATGLGDFWPTWPRWWVGDAVGVLLIAPAIIVRNGRPGRGRAGLAERRRIVAALFTVTVVALVPWPGDAWQQGLPYLLAPALVVVAMRMGPWAATLGTAATGLTVNAATAAGIGPFAEYGTYGGLVAAQVCLAAAAFAGLTVMALSHDLISMRELSAHRIAIANVLAHEIKSPLAAILGNAEFLDPDGPPEQTVAARGAIERGALRISGTIDDMLALAQISDANAPRVLGQVDLVELVVAALELNRANAERTGVHLRAISDARPLLVRGQRDELDKMVQNLIANAVKYTPAGGAVTVTSSRAGDSAVLVVADDGIGIATEEQARVFDQFFRSTDPAARNRPGTGLGLSIVLGVVERHGGSVTLDSELGLGSTFTVRIPCEPGPSSQRSSPTRRRQ